jgi:siroheme synthase-like protein
MTTTNAYYPVFLNIRGKKCLVVGGGAVALRRVEALLEHGAHVTAVSPCVTDGIRELAADGKVALVSEKYQTHNLQGMTLVIAATDDPATNRRVAREAAGRRIPVNVVDAPELCNFIVPAVVRRGDLTIAVSTGGESPALARKMRVQLEKQFGEEYAVLTRLVGDVRREMKAAGMAADGEAWQDALDLDRLLGLLRQGKEADARDLLVTSLRNGSE